MLDEYWYYSLFTLAMLLLFEVTVCYTRLRSMRDLRGQKPPGQRVYVFRQGEWSANPVSSAELLPGDIVSINASEAGKSAGVPSSGERSCPCDALLLRGSAVVNEAMLTGESVPKLKEPIDVSMNPRDSSESITAGAAGPAERNLSFTDGTDKRHVKNVLFCGTQILKLEKAGANALSANTSSGQGRGSDIFQTPDGGCTSMSCALGLGQHKEN